ncbi:ZNF845 [Branchiostoma lanceolatum]|uniref:ZNF845 protein n=1 Tax=Branchiostoma lanceolatum TaxID=7740 RepID=A0A8K0EML9_BRALA|nr:ZNF845 [Branchiostoma lanceolatum]
MLLHMHSKTDRAETEESKGDGDSVCNTSTDVGDPETSRDDANNDGKVNSEKGSKPVPGIRLVMTGSGQYRTTEPSKPASKMIYCDHCDHSTTRPRDMKVHVRLHTGERPYACPDCPFRAIQSHHLQKHQKYHQANLAQKCKLCTFSCRSASLLRSHVQLHNDKRNWHRCPHCNFMTSSYRVVHTHIKKQHVLLASSSTEAAYALPVEKTSPSPQQDEDVVDVEGSEGAEEEDRAEEEGVYVVEEEAGQSPDLQKSSDKREGDGDAADDSEEELDVLSVNQEQDTAYHPPGTISNTDDAEESQVKCDHCELFSATHVDHLIHLSVHTKDKTICCDQCDYTTSNKSLFKQHWQTHTSENLFKCDLCPYRGTGRANLLQHQSFHSAKQALKCRWCSFSCSERQHLDNHSRLHGQGRFKYKCQYCQFNTDKVFLHLVHKAKHSSTEIMKCNMCKSFQTKDTEALKEHLKKHTHQEHPSKNLSFLQRYKAKVYAEDDLYGCKLCPYKTLQPKSLIVHLSWHGANEVYKCPFCNFSHTRSYIIDDHKKLHGYMGSFKCNQCSFATDEKYRLLKHKAMHSGRQSFKCDQCDYTTDNSHRLKIHTTRHNGQKTHMCPLCPFETMSKTDLKVHKQKHGAKHSQKCKYCTYSCENNKHLAKHLKLHEDKTELRCLKCDFVATSECSLSWHELNHHKDNEQQPDKSVVTEESDNNVPTSSVNSPLLSTWRYQRKKCPQCPFVAQDLNRLQDHVQKHGAALPFKCRQCSYTCERETDLTQHSRCHGVKGAFVCKECPYSTEKKLGLLLHQVAHASDGMYRCDQCALKTSDKELLLSHMKEHDGTQVFRCSECPYSTVIESYYVLHQRRHHVRLPLCCKYCSYSAGKKKDFEQHTRMHERRFHCTECTYTTDSRYHYLVHKGLHTEMKVFSCDKCPFHTKAMVALKNHLLNQCNSKKLRCSECPFATDRKENLITHMKYHNVNLQYKCPHCSFSTALGWHLNKHAKVHKRGTVQKPSASSKEQHDSRSDNEEQKNKPSLTETDHDSDVEVEDSDENDNADQFETSEKHMTKDDCHGPDTNRNTDETMDMTEDGNVPGESESSEGKVMDVSEPSTPVTTSTPQPTEKQQTVFNLVKSYSSYHLSCRFCPYKTSKRIHHMSHEAKHGADLPFKCSKCSYSDHYEGKIAIHMRVHGCPGRYQCPHCYYSTNNEGFLQVHMSSRHRTSKVFHCSKCDFSTQRPKYLKEHIYKQHLCKPLPTKVKVLEYKCIRCTFQAATLADLWEHHKIQHKQDDKHYYKDGVYKCHHCSFVAPKHHRMARHIRIHLRDLAYTPQPTDKGTEASSSGNNKVTPTDGDNVGLDEDGQGVQSVGDQSNAKYCKVSDAYEKPVEKSKNTARKSVALWNKERPIYQCPDCDYTATRQHLLLAHAQNVHRKEAEVERKKVAHYPRRFKLFKCHSCPYSSYRQVHVTIHEKYHTANYPFKCDQCTYTCQFLYKLLQHKALHERGDNVSPPAMPRNITVYKCPLCPYTSYKRTVVQEHKTYHKADYPHKCSECSYSCKTDAKLQDHIKLHTSDSAVDGAQEEPTTSQVSHRGQASLFKCSMCPYTSYKGDHVYCHERLHYANLPNKCCFCTYSSLFEYKVKQHQKLHEMEDGLVRLSDTSKDVSQDATCSTMESSTHENDEDVTAAAHYYADEELQSEGILSKKRGLNAVFDNSDRYPLRAEGRLSIRLFRCAKCHFYSKSWRLLQLHKAQHELKMIRTDSMKRSLPAAQPDREAEGGRYFCRYCPYGSTHISHVWRHEERHNAGLPFKCRYCSYSSMLEFWTDRHEAVHKEERQVEAMQDIRDLQIQPEERSPVFAYGDDKLFAGIDTEEELATNSDGSDDAYSCRLCGRTFEEWRAYRQHARRHRQAGGEHVSHAVALGDPFTGRVFYVFTCKLCGRRFTGQVDWIQHMQHHRRNNRVPDRR